MAFFVARQPIFDQKQEVYGYELFYRDGFENVYNNQVDGDKATYDVLTSSFMVIGINELTGGKKAFINFTEKLLKDRVPTVFDKGIIVIELLEQITPDENIIAACKEIKAKGYTIALDDFVLSSKYLPLLKIADIIKVDYLNTSKENRRKIIQVAKKFGLDLLAEKVETRKEFKDALDLGYKYFQGYFFSKPRILKGDDPPAYKINYFQALKEINREEIDIKKLAEIIKRDVALSYKLLKLINSAAFGVRNKIESIQQAIVLLGLKEIRKWMNLVVIKEMANEKEIEIIRLSLIRAKFCESLTEQIGEFHNRDKYFMVGLFSLIDVLLKRKLEHILKDLPIADEIRWSLLGYQSLMNDIYQLVVNYEKANWNQFELIRKKAGVKEEIVAKNYLKAVKWCNQIMQLDFSD